MNSPGERPTGPTRCLRHGKDRDRICSYVTDCRQATCDVLPFIDLRAEWGTVLTPMRGSDDECHVMPVNDRFHAVLVTTLLMLITD